MEMIIQPNNEHYFFLRDQDKAIYCTEFIPNPERALSLGIIICPAIWGERIRTARILSNIARMLQSKGAYVITFDYFGDGNSGGETLDLNFTSMVDDVMRVYAHLQSRPSITKCVLVGFRLGANCAIGAEKEIKDLERMLLIEPLPSLANYLKTMLRSHIATQMRVHKTVLQNREALIAEIKQGKPLNMDGFLISKELWDSFDSASETCMEHCFEGNVTVVSLGGKGQAAQQLNDIAARYTNGRFVSIEQEFIWTDWKYYIPEPPVFMQTVLAELELNGKEDAA